MPLKLITAVGLQCCYLFFVYIARQKRLGRRGTTRCSWLQHPQLIFKHVNAPLKMVSIFAFILLNVPHYVKTQLLSWVTASSTCCLKGYWPELPHLDFTCKLWEWPGRVHSCISRLCVCGMCKCLKILSFHWCVPVSSHHKPPKVSSLYLIWLFKELRTSSMVYLVLLGV